jgi:hypothetical protein
MGTLSNLRLPIMSVRCCAISALFNSPIRKPAASILSLISSKKMCISRTAFQFIPFFLHHLISSFCVSNSAVESSQDFGGPCRDLLRTLNLSVLYKQLSLFNTNVWVELGVGLGHLIMPLDKRIHDGDLVGL